MAKKIMVQGTSSGAGKSIISTALCRIFTSDGHQVAPFKPQNMALNSFVTEEGLEMGRAQVVQAEAAGKKPTVHMNPILLKPTGNNLSQVIIQGKVWQNMDSKAYREVKRDLLPTIKNSFDILAEKNYIIVIEGAGSPAELNMMKDDISNMASADYLDAPVILVADIDRGGVFASIYGTIMLQEPENKERFKGIIINKFKGRKELLQEGIQKIEELTGVPVLGVMPYTTINLEDEDSITEKNLHKVGKENEILIEIVRHPHLSNSTDFEFLRNQKDVNVRYVELDGHFSKPDLIILPGTKNTTADLRALKSSALFQGLFALHKDEVPIVGICGGFQMLGAKILDPNHLEDQFDEVDGLGLLNHTTIFEEGKTTTQARAKIQDFECKIDSPFANLGGIEVVGYEVHSGKTLYSDQDQVFTSVCEILGEEKTHTDGLISKDGNVIGTYFHGIFDNAEFTNGLLNNLRKKKGLSSQEQSIDYETFKEMEFQKLESVFRENVDVEKVYEILR